MMQRRFFAHMIAASAAGVVVAAAALPALAQSADEAERAEAGIERVDPTTLGPSQVVNPSLAQPYAAPMPAPLELAPVLSQADDEEVTYSEAPRGSAVRMIQQEIVQPLPAPDAAAAPARATHRTQREPARDDPFVIKSILPIEGTIRYGDWFWDESAAPATGTLVITIDLEARVLSAFRDGHEIGTAVVLVGTQQHPTPLGSFPVLRKNREYFSKKYNEAPMPHSLWITNTGIAIHGSPVTNGYASHGCIGVPDPFAEKLFAATKRGDKVIITRGRMIGVGDKLAGK
ncbi:MAG: L,D-transpeptidase family protein [Erythrobacter sp.]